MFVYFLPTSRHAPDADLYNRIGYACESGHMQYVHTTTGPSGEGLIVARDSVPVVHLSPGMLSAWTRIPGVDAYVRMISAPTPEAVQRKTTLRGESVLLGDGNRWMIPQAIAWPTSEMFVARLPRIDRLNDNGTWEPGNVVNEYDHFWQMVYGMMKDLTNFSYQDEMNLVTHAIGLNYFLGPAECNLLQLWSGPHRQATIGAIIDARGRDEIKKKQDSAT